MVCKNYCSFVQGTFHSIDQTLLQYEGVSYFSVVSLRAPTDKILSFQWCEKINVVWLRIPFILLTRPFCHIWLSHISVQFYLGDLLKKCYYSYGVHKSLQFCSGYPFILFNRPFFQYMGVSYFSIVSHRAPSDKMLLFWCFAKINVVLFRVPLLLLIRPFYHICVSHISVQFYIGDLLSKCYYSCGGQKSTQLRSGYL